MTDILFDPPYISGTPDEQLVQTHRYLFQLSEQLNMALTQIDRQIETASAATPAAASAPVDSAAITAQVNDLKSLIIKTAADVRSEMDAIETELRSDYVAQSEWGEYQETVNTQIVQTAQNTVESYGYTARLDGLDEQASTFSRFRLTTNSFIKQGIIGYDADNSPIIGIAIGRNLRSTSVTIGSDTYDEIDMTQSLATYTNDRVSFWQNGVCVAYFSDSTMQVTAIEVADSIKLGGKWEISKKHGFSIKWIGG